MRPRLVLDSLVQRECPQLNELAVGRPGHTECVGAEDEPQCKLVCPADCIEPNPDFAESADELQAKYASLHA